MDNRQPQKVQIDAMNNEGAYGNPQAEIDYMNASDLEAFFYPQSLAVVGASQNALKPNGIPLYLLSMFGYQGDVYPVNPKYENVGGLKCYRSVLDIEGPVELAIIGVNEAQAMGALYECAEKGVKAAIVFTSGFAEVSGEGRARQAEMKELARKSGMRILGPNCLGVLNYYNGCMASFFYNQERKDLVHPETLSFITQSGGLGGIIYQMVIQLSIGFNYFVSTGNEADVSFAEVLNYLAGRDEVSIVAGYLEGLQGDGRLFIEACKKALASQKLVTMLKVGRTASGAAAAASHTGALVGSDQVYDAVFKQFGVPRADDVEQMNALITLYAAGRLPKGKKMAIITISGGSGVVVADKCPEYGIDVVHITEPTQEKLRQILPPFGAVKNPVDLTSQLFFDTELFQRALRLVMQDPAIDIGGFFYNLEMPDPDADKKIIDIYKETDKPLVVFTWPTGQDYAMEAKRKIVQAGVPVIEHIPSGLWAISALADWVQQSAEERIYPVYTFGREQAEALQIIQEGDPRVQALTEERSKQILKAYGIPVTRELAVQSAQDAVKAAAEIGYPVALKVLSPQILHKSEAGGVFLGLQNAAEVEDAYHRLLENAGSYNQQAHIEGVLVQEMLGEGLEIIVGIKKDPVFGPAVMLGLGGIFVEVLKDVSTRIAPLRRADALAMIDDLKGRAMFDAVRGRKPRDREALVELLLKVSRLAVELEEELAELDINPLILFEEGRGCMAADALFIRDHTEKGFK